MAYELRTRASAAGSWVAEGFFGLGAITLAVIAMARVVPGFLLSIGVIAAGTALLFDGGAVWEQYGRLRGAGMKRTGMVIEFFIGVLVAALGVLSLMGFAPNTLVPVSIVLLGIGLVIDSCVHARLNALEPHVPCEGASETTSPHETADAARAYTEMAQEASMFSVGFQAFIGVGVLTLGVLALNGVQPAMTLCLVALMGAGLGLFFSSTAATAMLGLRCK